MDLLYISACEFQNLLHKQYNAVVGYKGKLTDISFYFLPSHYYHLIGLHKLSDIPKISGNLKIKMAMLKDIINRKITYDDIQKSSFIQEIAERIRYAANIKDIINSIDKGKVILGFNGKQMTRIQADFLIPQNHSGGYLHLFLNHENKKNLYVPCSFFFSNNDKYMVGQKKFTTLTFEIVDISKSKKF